MLVKNVENFHLVLSKTNMSCGPWPAWWSSMDDGGKQEEISEFIVCFLTLKVFLCTVYVFMAQNTLEEYLWLHFHLRMFNNSKP